MAALPSPTQVAGTHSAIYEAYYNQVDPNGTGVIQAFDAARFLKKSKLSDVILSKIWDLSDPSGKGYLDKGGLFVALKLVALAQSGKEIAMSNINSETPPPKLGELPKVPPAVPPPTVSDWSVKPAERDKYNQLFESLQPTNGLIPGNKVKGVLMDSKLPLPTLGKIWDLADQDKDGMLDRHEFIVAMHLVYKALEKHAIPAVLPPELKQPLTGPPVRPPSRPASRPASPSPARPPPPTIQPISALPPKPPLPINGSISQPPLIPGLSGPSIAAAPPEITAAKPWVVTAAEKQQYDTLFIKADVDMDGYVSGMEIKDTFLQSGLPSHLLAHIWGLCDWDSSGKLSCDQFALAMWMVQRKLRGIDPPAALAPEMIPPSARTNNAQQPPKEKELSLGPQPTPEMEALARDMEQLARERLALESEVTTKEQSIRVKTNEANSLQSELDTLAATLKQLENQRGEAQKRLNDLQAQVEKLRLQANTQETAVKGTEAEAAAKREAAQGLKKQEQQLEDDLKQENSKIDKLNDELQQSVLAISQANLKITHLEEQERQVTEAAAAVAGALSGGPAPSQQYLSLSPPLSPTHLNRMVQGNTPSNLDTTSNTDDFGNMNGDFASDPFKDDPFGSKLATNDPFAAAFPVNKPNDGFASDPFASSFGGSTPDPFGGDAFDSTKDNKPKVDDNKDAFGCDPFAILHAPTRDGSSPTPSLPPKKHKTPPPRPAPPRPQQPSQATAFSADFSNFNNKFPTKGPSPPRTSVSKPKSAMEFTEDPFRDYRYEDPFNLEDPFADVTDNSRTPKGKTEDKNSNALDKNDKNDLAAFETDDFFSPLDLANKKFSSSFDNNDNFDGRLSVPLPSNDPFSRSGRISAPTINNNNKNNNSAWSTWSNNESGTNWAASDDNWATSDNWTSVSQNATSNNNKQETTSSTKKSRSILGVSTNTKSGSKDKDKDKDKDKSPRPRYGRSLASAVPFGSLGRHKNKPNNNNLTGFPSEEQQLAWAAAEGKRLEEERRQRQEQEDRDLQMAMALSIKKQAVHTTNFETLWHASPKFFHGSILIFF